MLVYLVNGMGNHICFVVHGEAWRIVDYGDVDSRESMCPGGGSPT